MASFQEQPLAAGLLTALVSSVVQSPTPVPFISPASFQQLPSSTPNPGYDNGGEDGGGMPEWSSLIGIVTALTGNVLISLALNIQRYAHVKINKEWEQRKLQEELDWKRAISNREAANSYGTVADHDSSSEERRGRGHFNRYRDESPSSGPVLHDESNGHGTEYRDDDSDSQDDLNQSFLSDRTMQPGDKDLRHGSRKSYLRSPYWWAGIVLMTLGEMGNFMAYGFAPASIVSPLGVVALISNCVIAPIMLKETFRKQDFWGVIIAIAGAAVVVFSAKSSEEKIGPHDIWVMITRWEFELYLGLSTALIVVLMWASGKYGSRTILIDVGLVALFGGYTALSTKGVSSLLSFTLWHVITFPITYLLVFVLVFSALMQIRYINRALQRFDSTQVIPTQFVLFTLCVIIGSAVLYRDFESYTAERAAKFVSGCLMTFLGVYFITSGRVRADDESSFSIDDEEEAIGLLGGERYHDRVDMSPPSRQVKVYRPGRRIPKAQDDDLQSPSGSLLSHGIESVDENQPTPLSAAPSSPTGSLNAESHSQLSPGHSSHLHSSSLLTNPWADHLEQHIVRVKSEPRRHRPATPPEQSEHTTTPAVLFRFPSAPGLEDQSPGVASSSGDNRAQQTDRTNVTPQTPPARRLRNSISKHFSPGTLLPTISAGFSAVVAESLRHGETSPLKERKSRRVGRRKQLSAAFPSEFTRNTDGKPGDAEYNRIAGGLDSPFALATARLRSTPDLSAPPVAAGNSTRDDPKTKNGGDITSLTRLRSLSDSWSGGLAWLGGTLRGPSHSNNRLENASAAEGDGNEHSADSQHVEGERDTGADPRE